MIGLESTSNNKYEPPCKSRPRLTFLDKILFSPKFVKLTKEKNDKIIIVEYIINNFIFEKYNTKYNYFFESDFRNKPCIVDCTT